MTKANEEKIKYIWISEKGSKTCEECSSFDGEKFDSLEDVPEKTHPNCKCEITEVVSSSTPNNPDDTINVKEVLSNLGYYKTPEWGITPYSDGAMYDGIRKFQSNNNLQVDGIMKPGGETVKKMNEKLLSESLSAAGMQGLSLGWSDEMHGVAGGLGYGVGSLNKNWNKSSESFKEAFKRGYVKTRDEHRNLLEEGYKEFPAAMILMESAGAISSPINKFFNASKTAPLSIKSRTTRNGAIVTGIIYGTGVSKSNSTDYIKSIISSVGGSYYGYKINNNMFGRAGNPILRNFVGEITDYGFKKARNLLEDNK